MFASLDQLRRSLPPPVSKAMMEVGVALASVTRPVLQWNDDGSGIKQTRLIRK